MSELISVIVPVYNVEEYLEKCIQSICNQSYRNLEIILSDDGSTDSSGAICDAWAMKDVRIRLIHKINGGLSDARNAGIEIASGSWYAFIDSDDFITLDTLERMYTAAVENDCQMAVCNIQRIYEDGETAPFYCPVTEVTVYRGNSRFETLKQPSVCNKLFRAELFADLRFPKGKFYEDTFVYHILAHRTEAIALTGHDGYFYLSRRKSILGQAKYTDRYFDMVEAVYNRMVYLLEEKIPNYGMDAGLSLYSIVADAEKNIKETEENREYFRKMRKWYKTAFDYLIRHTDVNTKQKLRLILLRYFPSLHSKIYY